MKTLTKEQIKEIAEDLDMGFKCFLNKKTGEYLSFPDPLKHYETDDDAWKDDKKKLRKNVKDFIEIDGLDSHDSFQIMQDFAESLPDSASEKQRLINALNRSKPFREFKYEVDNAGEYREMWFEFKQQKLEEWVVKSFNDKMEGEDLE